MSILNKKSLIASMVVANAMLSGPVYAATVASPWGTVAALQNGWVIDRMVVFHSAPIVNPGGECTLLTNGYIINETDPGHKTSYALLLGALLSQREVQFVISGCFQGRPRIVSVSIR